METWMVGRIRVTSPNKPVDDKIVGGGQLERFVRRASQPDLSSIVEGTTQQGRCENKQFNSHRGDGHVVDQLDNPRAGRAEQLQLHPQRPAARRIAVAVELDGLNVVLSTHSSCNSNALTGFHVYQHQLVG